MRHVPGLVLGPALFDTDTRLDGMVDGVATASNCTLHLHGMVTGDLFVEQGAIVELHGKVNGEVVNLGGSVRIYGTVGAVGGVYACEIMPDAVVMRDH